MEADRRLEQLRRQGRHILSSSFQLDAEQAREKLARYQLVDPHRYVLQFVQAAVLLGATRIDIWIDANELELTHDGGALAREQLADVYLRAFARAESDAERAIRHLAIGLIASSAVVPERVEIDFHGDDHVRLLIEGDDEQLVDISPTDAGQRVYVRETFRAGHLVEFFRRFGGRYAEEAALADAVFAPCTLQVNGSRIWREPPAVANRRKVDTPLETGWLTLADAQKYDGKVAFMQNGVVVERSRLDIGNLDIGGAVDTRRLTTNLSHSAFVRSEPWHELHDEVLLPLALDMLADRLERLLTSANRLDVTETIAAALRARARLRAKHRPLPPALDETIMRLADVPVWRHVRPDEETGRYLSTRDFLASIGEGPVPFATREHMGLTVRNEAGVVIPHLLFVARRTDESLTPELLAKATGREMVDLTWSIQEEHRKRVVEGRSGIDIFAQAGLTSAWPPELDERHRASATVTRDGVYVHVGVELPIVLEESRIVVVTGRDSVVRLDWRLPSLSCVTIAVVDTNDEMVSAGQLVQRYAPDITEAVGRMVMQAPSSIPPERLKGYLLSLLQGALAEQVASEIGIVPFPAAGTLARFARVGASPGRAAYASLGNVSEAKLFETLRGELLSLRSLGQRPTIDYIDARRRSQALKLRHDLEVTGHDTPVIWLSAHDRELLAVVFGEDDLRDVSEPLRIAATRAARVGAGMEEDPVLHGVFDEHRVLRAPGLEGQLGLSELVAEGGEIQLTVLHNRRRLTQRVLPHRFARMRAIIESDRLTPTPDICDVEEDAAYDELLAYLHDLAHELTEHALSEHVGVAPSHWASLCLWSAVLESVEEQVHDHRLLWPVFWRANGTRANYRELDTEPGGTLPYVRGMPGDPEAYRGLVLQLPLAPQSHLSTLRRLFADRQLVDQTPRRIDQVTATDAVVETTGTSEHLLLVELLTAAGHPVREVVFEGTGPPRIRGDTVTMPNNSTLTESYRKRLDDGHTVGLVAAALLTRRPASLQTLANILRKRNA